MYQDVRTVRTGDNKNHDYQEKKDFPELHAGPFSATAYIRFHRAEKVGVRIRITFRRNSPGSRKAGAFEFSLARRSGDFDVLVIRLNGDCLAGFADILQVKLDTLFDILEHFRSGVPLRHTPR
jgi:hypothetical protein